MKNLSGRELAKMLEGHGWQYFELKEAITFMEKKEVLFACHCRVTVISPSKGVCSTIS
jgi:hypothetical protein